MKKYTNKTLVMLIIIIALAALSMPLLTWMSQDSTNIKSSPNSVGVGTQYLNYKDFNALDISGAWQAQILPGSFAISLSNEQDAEYLGLNGRVLKLDNTMSEQGRKSAKIVIHMPDLRELQISGASAVNVANFKQKHPMLLKVELSGATKLMFDSSRYKDIHISMSGASNISFNNSELEKVDIDTSGVSRLELNTFTQGRLSGNVSGATTIGYSGTLIENNIESSGVVNISKK